MKKSEWRNDAKGVGRAFGVLLAIVGLLCLLWARGTPAAAPEYVLLAKGVAGALLIGGGYRMYILCGGTPYSQFVR